VWRERSSLTSGEIRRHAIASGLFVLMILALVAQLWPPKDLTFIRLPAQRLTVRENAGPIAAQLLMESLSHVGPEGDDARKDSERGSEAIRLLPGFIASATVLVLCFFGFLRGGTLLYFALPVSGILLLSSLVHGNRWHAGTIFLLWLFSMWVTAVKYPRKSPIDYPWLVWILVLTPQIYWSATSIAYDIRSPYSGGEAVANYLKQNGLQNRTIFAAGYPAFSIQPYFGKNLFSNYGSPATPAFWQWRDANTVPQMISTIPPERPDVIILVLHSELQRKTAQALLHSLPSAGYRLVGEFPGHLYWKAYELEAESFLVIRKNAVGAEMTVQ
jgi:hypothetical protein